MNKYQKYEVILIIFGLIIYFFSMFFVTEPKGIKAAIGIFGIMLSMFFFVSAVQYHILNKKSIEEK